MNDVLILPDDLAAIERVDRIEHKPRPTKVMEALAQERALERLLTGKTVPLPITADCSRRYTAVHSSGRRPLDVIRFNVMHAEEASTAESAASWFENPKSGGSTQLCADANVCYRCLPNDAIPWGAPGANYRGFHIEEAGYTEWDTDEWPAGTIERSAFKNAQHLRRFHLKDVYLDADALRRMRDRNYPATMTGYTTHLECTRAFGGDHEDPGAGWHGTKFRARTTYWFKRL